MADRFVSVRVYLMGSSQALPPATRRQSKGRSMKRPKLGWPACQACQQHSAALSASGILLCAAVLAIWSVYQLCDQAVVQWHHRLVARGRRWRMTSCHRSASPNLVAGHDFLGAQSCRSRCWREHVKRAAQLSRLKWSTPTTRSCLTGASHGSPSL